MIGQYYISVGVYAYTLLTVERGGERGGDRCGGQAQSLGVCVSGLDQWALYVISHHCHPPSRVEDYCRQLHQPSSSWTTYPVYYPQTS